MAGEGNWDTVLELTADELTQLRKPIRGSGGFQSFLKRVRKSIVEDSLPLTPELAADLVRYAEAYKQGGFQGRLTKRMVDAARSVGLREQLLAKSIDAYVMALETINRLTVKYRVEAFSYLICNAWELLLKAKILKEQPDPAVIYYKTQAGLPPRSIALGDCVGRIFTDASAPVRLNLDRVSELRDAATHLVISVVPKDVMCLFQSCVMNYHGRLQEWFGVSLSDRVSIGMMTIVYDFSPEQFDVASAALRNRLTPQAAEYLASFQAKVARDFEETGRSTEFSIPLDYRLALVKNPGKADITLAVGEGGVSTHMLKTPRDASETHPLVHREVVEAIRQHTGGAVKINDYDLRCVIAVHGFKSGEAFYYRSAVSNAPKQYSPQFVEWLKRQVGKDPQFFANCRSRAKSEGLLQGGGASSEGVGKAHG
jgi:hypothetical protein